MECRFAMGGIFTTKLYAEHKTFGYHQTVCGVRNPAYCKCAVICRFSVYLIVVVFCVRVLFQNLLSNQLVLLRFQLPFLNQLLEVRVSCPRQY